MIYFDNGATTFPKPPSVVRAVTESLQSYGANPGRSGHRLSLRAAQTIFDCRQHAAALFGAESPENIILTDSCTTALNIVLHGLLQSGDHVVISSLEHNAVARPLKYLKQTRGVSWSVAQVFENDDDRTLQSFRQAINGSTKLIVCTAASNVFGVRLPIARIAALCRIYHILFCVDAAQGAGILPLNVRETGIDFLCAAGHKGLYGPMGTGLLVINTDVLPEPLTQGGTDSLSRSLEQPDVLPDRYESGTPNLPGIAGLNEGIKFVLERGEERLLHYEMKLARQLFDGLSRTPGVVLYTQPPTAETHVPVVSFNIEGADCEEVAALLDSRFGIAVRAGLHCAPLAHKSFGTEESGTVRAVMSAYSKPAHITYFLASIKKIQKLLIKKVAIGNRNVLK